MIALIWNFLIGNKIARTIGMIVMAVLGAITFGKVNQWKGARDAKAKQAQQQAAADRKAHERINEADLGIGATDGERIDRLREFAAKHGNGQAKGPSR